MLFCSLITGITLRICVLCFALINSILLNLFCVWVSLSVTLTHIFNQFQALVAVSLARFMLLPSNPLDSSSCKWSVDILRSSATDKKLISGLGDIYWFSAGKYSLHFIGKLPNKVVSKAKQVCKPLKKKITKWNSFRKFIFFLFLWLAY